MAKYADKDSFLDALFDHFLGDDEPDEEYETWFNDKVVPFFDDEGEENSGETHRRRTPKTPAKTPAKRAMPPRRKSRASSGSYGSSAWFGSSE